MAKKNTATATETAPKAKWARVGSMLQSKTGSYYIKLESDIELKAGETLVMQKPQDEVARLVERGLLSQEKADERLAKIPDFVKFNIVKPPSDDSDF